MVYDCKPKAHFISKLEDKKVGALSKVLLLNKNKNLPESTASTSRSIASIFTRGEIKNWENLMMKETNKKAQQKYSTIMKCNQQQTLMIKKLPTMIHDFPMDIEIIK